METQIQKNLPPGYEDLIEEEIEPQLILRRAHKHIFRYRDTKKQTKSFLRKDIQQYRQDLKRLNILIKRLKKVQKKKELVSLKRMERKNLQDHILIQKYRLKALEEAFNYCIREHKRVVAMLTGQKARSKEKLEYIG